MRCGVLLSMLYKTIQALFLILSLQSAMALKTIRLEGSNDDYKCSYRSLLLNIGQKRTQLDKRIENLNLSLDCLTSDLKHTIEYNRKHIRGITFGTHASVTKGVSFEGGVELVIMVKDQDTLMLGFVNYLGLGASIALPYGASITRGVIHGQCKDIDDYLGSFQTVSVLGMNKSIGTKGLFKGIKRTRCDGNSITLGATSSLVGVSSTKYSKMGEYYLLKGQRVEELIEFITRYHPVQ